MFVSELAEHAPVVAVAVGMDQLRRREQVHRLGRPANGAQRLRHLVDAVDERETAQARKLVAHGRQQGDRELSKFGDGA